MTHTISFARWVVYNNYRLHPITGKWVFKYDINGEQLSGEELYERYVTDRAFRIFPVIEDSGEPDDEGYYKTIDTNERKRDEWIDEQLNTSGEVHL